MKSKIPVGIKGYGAYIPHFRLPTTEIAKLWRGGGVGPNREKAVANADEDSTTMSVEAGRVALKMAGEPKLGAVFVGTESKPYAVKPTSTMVAQALGHHETLAADFEFACKAGTEAIQVITGLAASGMIDAGLAIAVDTAQGRPGDDLEFTAASGAAAFVLGRAEGDVVAHIDGSVSYVSDTGDFWRRPTQKYPRHLARFTGEPAYFHHVESAVKLLFEEFSVKPSDFKYAVFHQPNPRFPVEVALRLGFRREQIETGLINPALGNAYSACSPLGLIAILDEAEPGDRILLASFGSGAGSDAFILTAGDILPLKRRESNNSFKSLVSNATRIDYSTYAKLRGKYSG